MDNTISLIVWSDFLWPWCYVGTVRLDDVKNHFGDKVYISWKSFLLKQAGDTPDRAKFVRYSQGWESIHNQEKRTEFRPWEGDNDPPSGSLPAQIAHKLVSELWPEKAMLMHYRLLEAYFSENRTISFILDFFMLNSHWSDRIIHIDQIQESNCSVREEASNPEFVTLIFREVNWETKTGKIHERSRTQTRGSKATSKSRSWY